MTAIEARIECLPTDVLANVCCGLMNDFRPEADTVFAAALAECQKRMTSPEFLALCDRMPLDRPARHSRLLLGTVRPRDDAPRPRGLAASAARVSGRDRHDHNRLDRRPCRRP